MKPINAEETVRVWPMRMAAASGWKEREPSEEKKLPDDRRGEECA